MYDQTVCLHCTYPQWKHEHSKFGTCSNFEAKPLPIDEKENFLASRATRDKETEIILDSVLRGIKYTNDIAKDTGIHRQRVYYHLNKLRAKGQIERINGETRVPNSNRIAYQWLPTKEAKDFLALEDD